MFAFHSTKNSGTFETVANGLFRKLLSNSKQSEIVKISEMRTIQPKIWTFRYKNQMES